MRQRHPSNAPGAWYVDSDCINCKAAQTVAPHLIVERDGQSVFAHQPEGAAELTAAWRARLLCPTASIHAEGLSDPPPDIFPEPMTEGVFRLGFNARNSWGAHSFFIARARGNAMVDAPRWTKHVTDAIAARGGLAMVLLTHRDDVADAERYASHFGALYRDAEHRIDDQHPGMHRTLTVDYAIVLEGEIVAMFDEGETVLRAGDILVQRGTSHAWANRSDRVARICFVLIDGAR